MYHLVSPKLWSISYTTLNRPFDWFLFFSTFDMEKFRKFHRHHWKDCLKISSLLSKRFQSSYGAKVRAGAKNKKVEGGGGREKRNPPPPPVLPFFLLSSQLFSMNSRGNVCYAGYKISKIAKFESDNLFKTNEYAAPQCREILQTFVWWGTTNYHFQI